MPPPFPKKRTLWPLVLIPLLLGFFYLSIAFPRFCDDLSFVGEHLIILAFWIITTALLMLLTRDALLHFHLRLVFFPTVILPALSCFGLYLIYLISIVGNIYWGATPNFSHILLFIPHLFALMESFQLPPALLISALVIPFAGLILIFQGRTRDMIIWYWALKETFVLLPRHYQKMITVLGVTVWVTSAVFFALADTSIKGFLNFNHDPIITFFKTQPTFFTMTKERVFWAQKDQEVQKTVKRQIPKVHNILLFCVDALRADHLPAYGYPRPLTPFLDGFLPKAHSRQIHMALSTGLETITGTMCLLNSKEPMAMSHLNYTLPDFLADQGFKTTLILAGSHNWQLKHKAFGRKIDVFFDGSEHPGPKGPCDDALVIKEIASLNPDDGGYHFFYIHLISVHPLGAIEDDFLRYQPVRSIIVDNTPFLGNTVDHVRNLYDDRILQMDNVFKKVIGLLRQKGYLNDYVAAITGDHGQILGENGKYGHGHFADIEGLRVPLIFFGSKALPAFTQSRFAVQLDVAPTLTDIAGVNFPSTWQGQSLLRPRNNHWSYHLSPYAHPGQEGAVVYYTDREILKYSRALDNSENLPGRLFDLSSDAGEKINLIDKFDTNFLDEIRNMAHLHFTSY